MFPFWLLNNNQLNNKKQFKPHDRTDEKDSKQIAVMLTLVGIVYSGIYFLASWLLT